MQRKLVHKRGCYAVFLLLLMTAFASTSIKAEEDMASQLTDLYSDLDTQLRLSLKSDAVSCEALFCEANHAFDQRVAEIAHQLIGAAIKTYPNRASFLSGFDVEVIEKNEVGIASNSRGHLMVFRGLQYAELSDDALAFVLAREMAHVLAGHHNVNVTAKLMISALATVIFPAVAVVAASNTAAQASTATTLVTSAASTATSMVGGEVAVMSMKPDQLEESDQMALNILAHTSWDMRSAEGVLQRDAPFDVSWWRDLEASRAQLATRFAQEDACITPLFETVDYKQ